MTNDPAPLDVLREDYEAARPLRILHLEDNLHDRLFIRRALVRGGIACDVRYAADEDEFSAALDEDCADIILSDFTLPGYDGSSALALARKKRPDVPYLFVSGTIGEERAVESLRNGAGDYVLKSNLARLPAAVRNAMREVVERRRRRRAEQALRESEARFREMAAAVRDVFWIAGPDGRLPLYVSPGYEHVWGRPADELHKRPALWLDSIHPEDRDRVRAALRPLAEGRPVRVEYRIVRPDGAVRWVENRGYPSRDADSREPRAAGVAADITERRALQDQLLQSQKMDAVGQLAGGVAHDFNNLLTVINGYAGLALGAPAVPAEFARYFEQIQAAGQRAAALTRQLLVFSRRETLCLRLVDLNGGIEKIVGLLARLIGEHIRLSIEPAPDLPSVEADLGMIEQILVNLSVNARDAMPRGGRLAIRTATRVFDEAEVAARSPRRPGRFARLSVSDTGTGISPEILPRIFDPFFTTKPADKGTGLGLAVVFGIVETHRGWIEVDTAPGAGTTFSIFLPACENGRSESDDREHEDTLAGGTETILLVEDDEAVRQFTASVLRHCGYHVHEAPSGRSALPLWEKHRSRIDLLLTDMVMPDDLDGLRLARTLRASRPSLRVICASGYAHDHITPATADAERIELLPKPYDPSQLARAVRECLDRP